MNENIGGAEGQVVTVRSTLPRQQHSRNVNSVVKRAPIQLQDCRNLERRRIAENNDLLLSV